MKKTIIFDTETTGIVPKGMMYKDPNYPRLLQLAWVILDEDGNELDKRKNYIKPNGFLVPNTEFHKANGLTQEVCDKGENPIDELNFLLDAIEKSEVLLAHNMLFDYFIIASELHKNNIIRKIERKPKYCTMMSTIDFCQLPSPYGRGFKFPRLEELYKKLFNETFENAHDAFADVKATARCYVELNRLGVPIKEVLK